jgi:quinol monooxygenase YgiN
MLTRIVKMQFKPEKVAEFLSHFDSVKDRVRNQPGCTEMFLYKDKAQANVYFTISTWELEIDLERYRKSEFFKEVWFFTKELFEVKAEAWSIEKL